MAKSKPKNQKRPLWRKLLLSVLGLFVFVLMFVSAFIGSVAAVADAQAQALVSPALSIKIARREATPDEVVGERLLRFLRSIAVLEDFVGGAELQDLPQRVLGEEGEHGVALRL